MEERDARGPCQAGGTEKGLVREVVDGQPYEYYPLGEHVVSAPGVCGGEPTFKYTRINVRFILERIEAGETVDDLLAAYGGRISPAALEEARRLGLGESAEEPAASVLRTA
jgi:uncharacterized protein (DUF433 family)